MEKKSENIVIGTNSEPGAMGKQMGGTHYKDMPIEPWEVIDRNQMGFYDGNALKYLLRFRVKNGKLDLMKAIHYIEKLIEVEYPEEQPSGT